MVCKDCLDTGYFINGDTDECPCSAEIITSECPVCLGVFTLGDVHLCCGTNRILKYRTPRGSTSKQDIDGLRDEIKEGDDFMERVDHITCTFCMDTGYLSIGGVTYPCSCLDSPKNIKSERPKSIRAPSNLESDTEAPNYIPLTWRSCGPTASRSKVFGGWIVRVYAADKDSGGPVFVPDMGHRWEV